MSEEALKTLSDRASEAHARIQSTYQHINPVVGVRRGMRDNGIPADAMTIECLQTRRRILLVLHDGEPDVVLYQFGSMDEDAGDDFERIALSEVGTEKLFEWMRDYLSDSGS
ncbi:hypothetical protein DES49_1796 [Halospina denitrificans]|uniref:Uncharacterized protein n=1 Tax=Halospina denitrificans TaxID=332522 RepID=A0A4R7JUT2_9GAMM|nr:hypothetical protein [Halospina denitrificans]TDT41694.1 hypothetical protein DES49_1796 [Halospina denitrificans]